MTNAFTAKPDLSKFMRQVKHAHHTSKLGQKATANPSPEQRFLFEDKRPTSKHGANKS